MDTELRHVPDAVGDVEEALLLALAVGVDVTRQSIRHHP
jgi:hypothetical protein